MIKKTEKKTAKVSKKSSKKPTIKTQKQSIIKAEDSTPKNTKKKDIQVTLENDEEIICQKKKKRRWPFRVLAFLLLFIGLLWFAQLEFFAKKMAMENGDSEAILDEEIESSTEIVDAQTGEVIEKETTDDDYSSKVEELKREDMPSRIDEELGEFDESVFNGVRDTGELKEPFEDDQSVFESRDKEIKLEEMEVKLAESNKKIEQLTKELEKTNVEVQRASAGRYTAPLVIKLINLKEKIGTGESFHTDLDDLEYFANGDAVILKAISDIRKYSDGLKTKTFINEEFQKSAIEVMKIHNAPPENASFFSKVMYNLTKNIVIRKTDESKKPSETEQILIDAEKLLSKEKYREAVLEIIKLNAKYSEPFDEWVDDTSEFVYVNEVLYQAVKYAEEKK
jgi:hypothetical protein